MTGVQPEEGIAAISSLLASEVLWFDSEAGW